MNPDPSTVLFAGRHLHLVERGGWECATRASATGVVAIVAVTDADELVLIRQRRPVVGGDVLELPAGLVGDDGDAEESKRTAAERELLEETGFAATDFALGPTALSSAGLTDEAVTFFVARGLTRAAAGGGVDGENIAVELVPLGRVGARLAEAAADGTQLDVKLLAGLALLGASVVSAGLSPASAQRPAAELEDRVTAGRVRTSSEP